MKIIKKYEYRLTEETLNEDIGKFIKEAQNGAYEWDYKHGMEGLRIIKQYFKLIQQEFEKENYDLCKICYKLILSLLFEEGHKYSYFGYEDIIGRSKLDFDKIISNYFSSMIKLHKVGRLFNEYLEYLKAKQEYFFESAEKTIMEELSREDFAKFKELLVSESEKVGKKDYAMHDILTFLLDIAKKKDKDKKKFLELAEKFAPVLGYDDIKQFLEDYEE